MFQKECQIHPGVQIQRKVQYKHIGSYYKVVFEFFHLISNDLKSLTSGFSVILFSLKPQSLIHKETKTQ